MAKTGRKPKPTALKKLEGNPGKRPLNELEPVPPNVSIHCPQYLLPDARREWKRLAPVLIQMGLLTAADVVPFAAYCTAFARWKEAEEEITKHGSIYKDGEGRIRPNPYIAIANQQLREIKSLAAEFGLTPSNRSAMIANVMSAMNQNADPMETILLSDDDVQIVGGSNFYDEEAE
ncbi:MAG: phage terminase small subunit P27 family [Clostridia bacterium]|nr:phage terminase small subunit P27 family [Clostridia bacterium]MBR5986433.1 phage terminase small subunit P27 family [Clostridia bacterium]MBR6008666.1 phage terminase small subunit P27 family [Clostridia bacterium]